MFSVHCILYVYLTKFANENLKAPTGRKSSAQLPDFFNDKKFLFLMRYNRRWAIPFENG